MFSMFGIGPARANDIGMSTSAISQNRHWRAVSPKVRPSADAAALAAAAAPASGRFSKNRNRATGKAIKSGSRPSPT